MRANTDTVTSGGGHEGYRHIVSLSGGKDSAALALFMLETFPDLSVEYVFCDTRCELPETYAYLDILELHEMYSGFLPSPRTRWCTRLLKIQVFENFIGDSQAYSYIGIRADENRDGFQSRKPPVLSQAPNIIPVYPFIDYGLGYGDIERILDDTGVGMPAYYRWRTRSGCYFCFYQQIAEWQNLKDEHPDLFERARSFEDAKKGYTWVDGKSLDEIAASPKRDLLRPDDDAGCAICHL